MMGKLARLPTSVTRNIGNVPDEAKEGSVQLGRKIIVAPEQYLQLVNDFFLF